VSDHEFSPAPDPSPERRIERLAAEAEIRQLAYRYAYAYDTRDPELFASVFLDTEPLAAPPIVNCMSAKTDPAAFWPFPATVLFVGNHLIEFDDDQSAHGAVYCRAQIQTDDDFIEQAICYLDRYVRTDDGRWLIRDRRHLLWFGAPVAGRPFEQAPANWPENQVGAGTLPGEFPTWGRFRP
jgi:hypothetical protein